MSAPGALLLDVEGTTTPVAFVTGTLFPFARQRLRGFLEERAAEAAVAAELRALAAERAREPASAGAPGWDERAPLASAAAYLEWLSDRDRKATPLKALQGMIWEQGFRDGTLVAPVYADVPAALARWRSLGRAVAIFSSGSVQAQRLLFAHTSAGDLSSLLDGYFDTSTGPKREAESYRRIAAALRRAPGALLFVSDVTEELDAAREAGLATALCVRPGAALPQDAAHLLVRSFDELP